MAQDGRAAKQERPNHSASLGDESISVTNSPDKVFGTKGLKVDGGRVLVADRVPTVSDCDACPDMVGRLAIAWLRIRGEHSNSAEPLARTARVDHWRTSRHKHRRLITGPPIAEIIEGRFAVPVVSGSYGRSGVRTVLSALGPVLQKPFVIRSSQKDDSNSC